MEDLTQKDLGDAYRTANDFINVTVRRWLFVGPATSVLKN
jgi:hypothetical protein